MARGAKKFVEVDGIRFDSALEAECYEELLTRFDKEDIELQPKFVLQESFVKDGKVIRSINYIGDFKVGSTVIDTKGFSDAYFKLKKKMFDKNYPDLLLLVVGKYQWYLEDVIGEKFGTEEELKKANTILKEYKKENDLKKLTKKHHQTEEFKIYFKERWNNE